GDVGNGAKGVVGAVGCGTSFCSGTCAILTSAVWRPEPLGKIIRRKLMPNLKDVTWRYPTLTPSRLAISSRLIPCATKSLISSITSGVNRTPSARKDGPALVIVMATPPSGGLFLVDLVWDVRCDGRHEMVDSGYNPPVLACLALPDLGERWPSRLVATAAED